MTHIRNNENVNYKRRRKSLEIYYTNIHKYILFDLVKITVISVYLMRVCVDDTESLLTGLVELRTISV